MLAEAFVTSASMLQVIVLLVIALITWLALLLLALALCRGAAAADEKAITASARRPLIPERPVHSDARPRRLAVPRTITAGSPHGTPRRYYTPSRARRGTKHTPRVS
jgi:hypothetical protein